MAHLCTQMTPALLDWFCSHEQLNTSPHPKTRETQVSMERVTPDDARGSSSHTGCKALRGELKKPLSVALMCVWSETREIEIVRMYQHSAKCPHE
jgi:hypothetical protein